jgi:hypothetical protein
MSWILGEKGRANQLAVWLGAVCGLILLVCTSRLVAECNCASQRKCDYKTCCYNVYDCKPTGADTCGMCSSYWDEFFEEWVCYGGTGCNCEPCGPIGG